MSDTITNNATDSPDIDVSDVVSQHDAKLLGSLPEKEAPKISKKTAAVERAKHYISELPEADKSNGTDAKYVSTGADVTVGEAIRALQELRWKPAGKAETSVWLPPMEYDRVMAEQFLHRLDPVATKFTFQTFDDNSDRRSKHLAKVLHGSLAEHWDTLVAFNEKGAGIFVTINRTDLAGRKVPNMQQIRAVWQEDDGDGTEPPLVHCKVATSPGHHHSYIFIKDGPTTRPPSRLSTKFKKVQQGMVDKYGSDPKAIDLPRVMRLPGFYHQKVDKKRGLTGKKFKIHITYIDDRATTWEEVSSLLIPEEIEQTMLLNDPVTLPTDYEAYFKNNDALSAGLDTNLWFNELSGEEQDTELEKMLTVLPQECVEDTNTWLSVLGSCSNSGAPNAEKICCKWSANSSKHTNKEFSSRYNSGWIDYTIGTLIKLAYQNGYEAPSETTESISSPETSKSKAAALDTLTASEVKYNGYELLKPQPRDWVVDNLLLRGKVSVLGGFGGVSKTMLAIQIAIGIALGGDAAGALACCEGSSLLLLGEEDQEEASRRIGAIISHEIDLNREAIPTIKQITDRVATFAMAGKDMKLIHSVSASQFTSAPLVDAIIQKARTMIPPVKFIAFDHLRMTGSGDYNDAYMATELTRRLTYIAQATGAAVLLLAHSPKSALNSDTTDHGAIAGSSAYVDNARAAMVLRPMNHDEAKKFDVPEKMRSDFVNLNLFKSNYSRSGEVAWFRRVHIPSHGTAVLELVNLSVKLTTEKKEIGEVARVLDEIKMNPGRYTLTKIRSRWAGGKKKDLSQRRVREIVDNALTDQLLVIRDVAKAEREMYGHNKGIKVLEVTPKGVLFR